MKPIPFIAILLLSLGSGSVAWAQNTAPARVRNIPRTAPASVPADVPANTAPANSTPAANSAPAQPGNRSTPQRPGNRPNATRKPDPKADQKAYTQFMNVGYAALAQRDYQTALINFRRALAKRPNDAYARKAIANTQAYIEVLRRQRIAEGMAPQLKQAVDGKDWACAMKIVDRMIAYSPQASIRRSELITYRGRLQTMLETTVQTPAFSGACANLPAT